ncbi:MAG: hypothetical protein KDI79_11600 [Anaerolineae bacterium]|nr:hypothetical protein [Anaerolineae bacterium]
MAILRQRFIELFSNPPKNHISGVLMLVVLLLGGCSGSEPAGPTPDLVGTEVAVQKAAFATLTAEAPEPSPSPSPTITSPAPTNTVAANLATVTPPGPTATSVPPTATIAVAAVSPTPTRLIVDILPVDGDSGNPDIRGRFNRNEGRYVVIPDAPPGSITDTPPEFSQRLVFLVEPYDPAIGTNDGDGIRQVNFTIINQDNDGEEVYTHTEQNPRYCAFGGGEPDCTVFVFDQNNFRWPGGPPLENANYRAVIEIVPLYSDPATWNWDFALRDVPEVDTGNSEIQIEWVQFGLGSLDQVVTTDLVFQVTAYDTNFGTNDGDGIDFVEMIIRNNQGQIVYRRNEQNAAYCAFSGGEPDCNRLPLNELASGAYTLQAIAHAVTGQTQSIETTIEIP